MEEIEDTSGAPEEEAAVPTIMEEIEDTGGAPEREAAVPTIEEHAKRRKTPPSIMAALMQFKHWAAGKRVSEEEFNDAIRAFLGSPTSGSKEG